MPYPPPKRPKRFRADRLDASAVTPEMALEWRAPRLGRTNPQRMDNPLWEWLVKTRINARNAAARFNYPPSRESGPAWCFDRMGQSVTVLPDGRMVLIGGEHEDWYDADFFIYNDVTIHHPDGTLELFGYPEEVFPPTDFHTATLLENRILIIGNVGYGRHRRPGVTQAAELLLDTWEIRILATTGESPGWIGQHMAEVSPDGKTIAIRGGQVQTSGRDGLMVENHGDFSLDVSTLTWTSLDRLPWQQFLIQSDHQPFFNVWEMVRLAEEMEHRRDLWWQESGPSPGDIIPDEKWGEFLLRFGSATRSAQQMAARLYREEMDPDVEIIRSLFHPPVPHQSLTDPQLAGLEEDRDHGDAVFASDEEEHPPECDRFDGDRIAVHGIVVRYQKDIGSLMVIIEGNLSSGTVQIIVDDVAYKLGLLVNSPVSVRKIE